MNDRKKYQDLKGTIFKDSNRTEWTIDSITDDEYFLVKRGGSYEKMGIGYVLECIDEDTKRKNIKPKWPIRIKHYMHDNTMGEDDDFMEMMMDQGLEEDYIWDTFRYLIYEMTLELDLYEDGTVKIVSIGDYTFPEPLTKWN